MQIVNGSCLHVVLYGTFIENKYFLGDYKDCFDLIGFNSNIIAHAPDGISAFISKLKNKSFFIDPQTHAFQHPVETVMRKKDGINVLKESIRKLADEYGSIFQEQTGIRPVVAGELDNGQKELLTQNVLDFQYSKIQKSIENLGEWEFLSATGRELRPEFLIAPYFFLDPDNLKNELEDNKEFILLSKKLSSSFQGVPIYSEIVLHKDVLVDPGKKEEVLRQYSSCDSDGFILWIDDFSEVKESKDTLKKYYDFIKDLSSCNKPILVLHGSYMSIALSGKAEGLLAGVGHGIEYGEYRPVIPVGGGVPLSKFYFPKFHKRVNYYPEAQNVILEKEWHLDKSTFLKNVCSCRECVDIVKTDDVINDFSEYGETRLSQKNSRPYPSPKAMDRSRRHYLNVKIQEYKYCKDSPKEVILGELKESKDLSATIKSHSFNHIEKWIEVLERSTE